jgi:hypothetical protein
MGGQRPGLFAEFSACVMSVAVVGKATAGSLHYLKTGYVMQTASSTRVCLEKNQKMVSGFHQHFPLTEGIRRIMKKIAVIHTLGFALMVSVGTPNNDRYAPVKTEQSASLATATFSGLV